MLKKAGIVFAVATAGALAVAPMAFAGEYAGEHGGHGGHGDHGHMGHQDHDSDGGGSRVGGCDFGDQTAANGIDQEAEAGGPTTFLGLGGTSANSADIDNEQEQSPLGSCNTVTDVVTIDISDDDTSTSTTDSFNEATSTATSTSILELLGLGDIL